MQIIFSFFGKIKMDASKKLVPKPINKSLNTKPLKILRIPKINIGINMDQ
jgi:hypothetical protein